MFHLELKSLKKKEKKNIVANESIPHLKRGGLIGVKNKNHREQKLQQIDYNTPKDSSSIKHAINIVLK
jgi:hypothetical protein